jgi:hypothetical protein
LNTLTTDALMPKPSNFFKNEERDFVLLFVTKNTCLPGKDAINYFFLATNIN